MTMTINKTLYYFPWYDFILLINLEKEYLTWQQWTHVKENGKAEVYKFPGRLAGLIQLGIVSNQKINDTNSQMDSMVKNVQPYKLHYVEVLRDVLRSPHCTNISCSVDKKIAKDMISEGNTHARKNGEKLPMYYGLYELVSANGQWELGFVSDP